MQFYYGTNNETVINVFQLVNELKKKAHLEEFEPISNLMVPSVSDNSSYIKTL
jgi:hypothetical protein